MSENSGGSDSGWCKGDADSIAIGGGDVGGLPTRG